jgi:uncharacterized protein (TIRG00374 family)
MISWRNTKILLGITISCVALILVFRKLNFTDLVQCMRRVDGKYVFFAILVMVINLFIRTKRWQVLLLPFRRVSWLRDSFTCYTIGYMANMLLPLKPGEFLRPYLLGKKLGIFKIPILATVVLERLWDVVYLVVLFFVSIEFSNSNISLNIKTTILLVGVAAGLVLAILWLVLYSARIKSMSSRFLNILPDRIYGFCKNVASLLLLGIKSLDDLWGSIYIFFLTGAVWMCSFFIVASCMRAFDLNYPWYVPLFATVVSNLGMIIPSMPGAIGIAHALYVFSLSVFGVDNNTAFSVAVLVHGISFIVVVFTGYICLWIEGVSFAQLQKMSNPIE